MTWHDGTWHDHRQSVYLLGHRRSHDSKHWRFDLDENWTDPWSPPAVMWWWCDVEIDSMWRWYDAQFMLLSVSCCEVCKINQTQRSHCGAINIMLEKQRGDTTDWTIQNIRFRTTRQAHSPYNRPDHNHYINININQYECHMNRFWDSHSVVLRHITRWTEYLSLCAEIGLRMTPV